MTTNRKMFTSLEHFIFALCVAGIFFSANTAFTAKNEAGLIAVTASDNVKVLLENPSGGRTGYLRTTGEIVTEIPGSTYYEERVEGLSTWFLTAGLPSDGVYTLRVVGIDPGLFWVEIETFDRNGNKRAALFEGHTARDRNYLYQINYSSKPGNNREIVPVTYDFAEASHSRQSLGEKISIAFTLSRHDGNPADDVRARLVLKKTVDEKPVGDPLNAESASGEYDSGLFKFDPEKRQYVFKLDTGNLEPGDWRLIVHLDDGSTHEVSLGLK